MNNVIALLLTPFEIDVMIPTSLEGLVNPSFGRAMGRIEQMSSRLPLDSCASKPSPDKDAQSPEAQELSGNFCLYWSAQVCADNTPLDLAQQRSLAMHTINSTILRSSSPLPAYCRVLSNARLVARGHNSVDDPFVPVGAIVKVEAIQSYAGYTTYARFCHQGVPCHLPITDLEELYLQDSQDMTVSTVDALWADFRERLSRMLPDEATAEMESVERDIRLAGGSIEVQTIFLQSALSTMRV